MALKNAPAKTSASEQLMTVFKKDLTDIGHYLETMLPKGVVPRFVRMAQLAVLRDPKLLECSKKSLLLALLWCAARNMEPGVEDGVWLIPFKGIVTPIPGYKGLINKAVEIGAAKSVDAYAVYEHDDFYYCYGLEPRLDHTPPKLGDDRGELMGAYAIVVLPDGEKKFRVMDRPALEKVRNSSAAWKAAPNTGPWEDWFEAQCLKTVIKHTLKTVPMKPDLRELLSDDGRIEAGAGVAALLNEAGAELPEDLQGAEEPGAGEEPGAKKADTSAFDLLVKKEMEGLDEMTATLRMEHLKDNLGISAKNTKKTIPQFKEFAANYFHPYLGKDNEQKPGFWKTFLAWEADKYPTASPEAAAEAGTGAGKGTGAGEAPGGTGPGEGAGEGTGPGEGEEDPFGPKKEEPQPIFADRKKALVMKILGKPIPLAELGISSLDVDITPENFDEISGKVEAILATGKKKK